MNNNKIQSEQYLDLLEPHEKVFLKLRNIEHFTKNNKKKGTFQEKKKHPFKKKKYKENINQNNIRLKHLKNRLEKVENKLFNKTIVEESIRPFRLYSENEHSVDKLNKKYSNIPITETESNYTKKTKQILNSKNNKPYHENENSKPYSESENNKPYYESENNKPYYGSENNKPYSESENNKPYYESENRKQFVSFQESESKIKVKSNTYVENELLHNQTKTTQEAINYTNDEINKAQRIIPESEKHYNNLEEPKSNTIDEETSYSESESESENNTNTNTNTNTNSENINKPENEESLIKIDDKTNTDESPNLLSEDNDNINRVVVTTTPEEEWNNIENEIEEEKLILSKVQSESSEITPEEQEWNNQETIVSETICSECKYGTQGPCQNTTDNVCYPYSECPPNTEVESKCCPTNTKECINEHFYNITKGFKPYFCFILPLIFLIIYMIWCKSK